MDRQTTLPLVIGGGLALLIHLTAMPWGSQWVLAHGGGSDDALMLTPDAEVADPEAAKPLPDVEPSKPEAPKPTPQVEPPKPDAHQPMSRPQPSASEPRAGEAPKVPPVAGVKPLPRPKHPPLPPPPTDMPEIQPGQAHSPEPLAVAWIAWDDYQKMVAPRGRVEQPALQKEAKTVPGAPLIADPDSSVRAGDGTPSAGAGAGLKSTGRLTEGPGSGAAGTPGQPELPRLLAPDAAMASVRPLAPVPPRSAELPKPTPSDPTPKAEDPKVPRPVPVAPIGDLAIAIPKPVDATPPATPEKTPEQLAMLLPRPTLDNPADHAGDTHKPPVAGIAPTTHPADPTVTLSNAGPPTPTPGGGGTGGTSPLSSPGDRPGPRSARPSGAPQTDRESPPVSLFGAAVDVPLRAGKVIAREGMEIRPIAPRQTVAMAYNPPGNPVARLVFNRAGEVVEVKLLRSTGSPMWDGPIIAALYRWTATGAKLTEIKDKAYMDVHIICNDLDD